MCSTTRGSPRGSSSMATSRTTTTSRVASPPWARDASRTDSGICRGALARHVVTLVAMTLVFVVPALVSRAIMPSDTEPLPLSVVATAGLGATIVSVLLRRYGERRRMSPAQRPATTWESPAPPAPRPLRLVGRESSQHRHAIARSSVPASCRKAITSSEPPSMPEPWTSRSARSRSAQGAATRMSQARSSAGRTRRASVHERRA